MSDTTYLQSNSTPTRKEIVEFIRCLLADFLHIDPEKFDVNTLFESYGMDSNTAVIVSGNLQEWLGIDLEPTLLFNYPNTETLAEYLDNLLNTERESVINYATEVFESAEIAEDWLKSSNPALGGEIPNDLLDTNAGIEQVRNLLGRIEYGVYS